MNHRKVTQAPGKNQPGFCRLGRRFLVMLYDCVAVIVILMLVTALLLLTPLRDQRVVSDPIPTMIMIVSWFTYLAWCWRHGGLTLGMRAWKVRLITEDGKTMSWGACVIRFLVSILSFACAGIGFFRAIFDPRNRTWHDLASKTTLVRQASQHRN